MSRNKVYVRFEPTKDGRKIYIICEGAKTEVKYFNFFDKFSSNRQIITVPPQNNQSAPDKLIELCEVKFFTGDSEYRLLDNEQDEIWFVIDTDDWNLSGKIDYLKRYCDSKAENGFKVLMVQSNRSFEIWQYYHRFDVPPNEDDICQHLLSKSIYIAKYPVDLIQTACPH